MRILISFLVAFAFCSITFGQKTVKNKPEILFTINDVEKVNKEEFVYMYKKNNFNNNKGYTKEDIGDYLNLYQIFKLKIVEAKQLGYDTTKAFKSEFNKYKNQLTDNYLRTNKITDSLINEAYLRYKEKIKASHILIKLDKNASPQDTLKAYMRIIEIREKAILENNFGELAQQFSDDPSAKTNKGDLSYFSSMNMVYPFETAAYNTPVGKISTPVRTQFGYHIIKVVDRSPNYKVEVAHIMVRVKNGEDKNAKDKIFDIHDQLNNGVEWEVACRQFSEDINTKNNKGKLKPFGVGQMPPSFQEIAFSLKNPNEYSDPFTTPYGWHIVKYIGKHEIESFDKIKPQIENRIKKDERVAISKKLLLLRLKKENNFLKKEVNNLESLFNETLLKGNWSNTNDEDFILFTINSEEYKFSNFSQYVKDNQKEIKGNSLEEYIHTLYNEFEQASVVNYEKDHLSEKYFEYKMLVNEYEEGIMLFNLMDDRIWKKAMLDTIGLKRFFNDNQDNYKWNERARVKIYNTENVTIINEIKSLIEAGDTINTTKNSLESRYNQNSSLTLQIEEGIFEKEKNEVLSKFNWQEGLQNKELNGRNYLVYISEIIPEGYKKLEDTKGLVISSYQEKLEKEWVKELKNKHTQTLNKKVFKNVIKELEK